MLQNGPMGRGRGRGRGDGGGRFGDRGPGGPPGRGRGPYNDGAPDFDDATTFGVPSDKCGLVIGKGMSWWLVALCCPSTWGERREFLHSIRALIDMP